jgi:RNA polymerase sigma-70 factor (ECF subfamily)
MTDAAVQQLNELSVRHGGYLWVLAAASLGSGFRNQLDPSDVVQSTFVRAAESLQALQGGDERTCRAWLRRILQSVLVDEYRRLHSSKRDVNLDRQWPSESGTGAGLAVGPALAADQISPSEAAVRDERLLRLAEALQQISVEQREVVVMRFLQGRTLQEIAEATQRTLPSVAGLLRRGLSGLRDLFPAD